MRTCSSTDAPCTLSAAQQLAIDPETGEEQLVQLGSPRRLKTIAQKAGKSWLHATLTVKSSKLTEDAAGEVKRPGLPASGMFLINPPHTLKAQLKDTLPQMVELLGQDKHATHTLESGS